MFERALDRLDRATGKRARNGIGRARHQHLVRLTHFQKPVAAPLQPGSSFNFQDPEGAPDNFGRRWHAAKDWFAPGGTRVSSPIPGVIVEVKPSVGNTGQIFGGVVKVRGRNGHVWVFRHIDPKGVRVGQRVHAGQKVGTVTNWLGGSDHVHIELWRTLSGGYDKENMIDPMKFLSRFL
jgi:murein DD-endopeptidase MepM/ murein hydrolase activator NlpD